MALQDFPLLSDENIQPDVVSYLRAEGFDVKDVKEEGMQGETDKKPA